MKRFFLNKITKNLSDISNLHNILIQFCKNAEQTEEVDAILSMLDCINEKTEKLYLYAVNLQLKNIKP